MTVIAEMYANLTVLSTALD